MFDTFYEEFVVSSVAACVSSPVLGGVFWEYMDCYYYKVEDYAYLSACFAVRLNDFIMDSKQYDLEFFPEFFEFDLFWIAYVF